MAKDYEVGYRKPPAETRFKPGQSGNRSGRPRKVASQDPFVEFFLEPMPIVENGKRKQETTLRTMLKVARLEILKGNPCLLMSLLKFHAILVAAHGEHRRLTVQSDEGDFNRFMQAVTRAFEEENPKRWRKSTSRSTEMDGPGPDEFDEGRSPAPPSDDD